MSGVVAVVVLAAVLIGWTVAGRNETDPGTIKIAVDARLFGWKMPVEARPESPFSTLWTDEKEILQNTGVDVTRGEFLRIAASGRWFSGTAWTSPAGLDRVDRCECPVAAPIGALIGRVGSTYFPVFGPESSPAWPSGALTATIAMPASGRLYLGLNDNLGRCDGRARGSCYDDNKGALEVTLTFAAAPESPPTGTSKPASGRSRTPTPPTHVPPAPPIPAPPTAVSPVLPLRSLRDTLRETFDGPALDVSQWLVMAGSPRLAGGSLLLHRSDIQSRASFRHATLRTAVSSGHWKPNSDSNSDSSIGFEHWEGRCHSAIVFKPNGVLGILNPRPDNAGRCQGDPQEQIFLALQGWDDLVSRTPAGHPLLLTLRWSADVVSLTVDPGDATPIEVSYLGSVIPHSALKVRLYACRDVPDLAGCQDEVFLIDDLHIEEPPADGQGQDVSPATSGRARSRRELLRADLQP